MELVLPVTSSYVNSGLSSFSPRYGSLCKSPADRSFFLFTAGYSEELFALQRSRACMSNPGLNGGTGVNTLCQNMWGCTARIISSLLHQQEANLFVRFDGRAEFGSSGDFFSASCLPFVFGGSALRKALAITRQKGDYEMRVQRGNFPWSWASFRKRTFAFFPAFFLPPADREPPRHRDQLENVNWTRFRGANGRVIC